jgi:hypothetical protein
MIVAGFLFARLVGIFPPAELNDRDRRDGPA